MNTITEYAVQHTAYRHGRWVTVTDQLDDPANLHRARLRRQTISEAQIANGDTPDAIIVTRRITTTEWGPE